MVAFLDCGTFLEESLFKVAFYSGLDLNPINGLHATDKIARFRDLLPLSKDGSDRRRFFLSPRGKNTQPQQNRNCASSYAQAGRGGIGAATQQRHRLPHLHYMILSASHRYASSLLSRMAAYFSAPSAVLAASMTGIS